jgi:hypothetical protein
MAKTAVSARLDIACKPTSIRYFDHTFWMARSAHFALGLQFHMCCDVSENCGSSHSLSLYRDLSMRTGTSLSDPIRRPVT